MAAHAEEEPNLQRVEHDYAPGRSFDLVASVNALRYDIENEGGILPETMQRIHDEELTYIAEGIDRHSYTCFDLQYNDGLGLVYFDRGEWRPYVGTLLTGLSTAKKEAKEDPRRQFLIQMAERDLEVGFKMQKLEPGESFSYYSPFPEEEYKKYGKDFMVDAGFQVSRKMGFVYRVERLIGGEVRLESYSIDNSDRDAFAAVESHLDAAQSIVELVEVYDKALYQKTGEMYRAGRKNFNNEIEENAWDFVKRNKRLFTYYFEEIEKLAYSDLTGKDLENAKKALTYGVWARTKELLDDQESMHALPVYGRRSDTVATYDPNQIALEVQRASSAAAARNDAMIGCGGAVTGKSFSDMSPSEVFESIFGENKPEVLSQTDKFGPLSFECPKGHPNIRPRNRLIDCCKTCGVSVKC